MGEYDPQVIMQKIENLKILLNGRCKNQYLF